MYEPAHANYLGDTFIPVWAYVFFYMRFFSAKHITDQIFHRLYIHEFLSEMFKTCNIDNRYYKIYISMTDVMQIFIVR